MQLGSYLRKMKFGETAGMKSYNVRFFQLNLQNLKLTYQKKHNSKLIDEKEIFFEVFSHDIDLNYSF